jgi:hypothetical protein
MHDKQPLNAFTQKKFFVSKKGVTQFSERRSRSDNNNNNNTRRR